MARFKFISIFLILIFLILHSGYSQAGTIKNIEALEAKAGFIKFNVYDVSVEGMYHKNVHFGMWLSQDGTWLEDSWVEIKSQYVKYDPAYWKGLAFWFSYSYEFIMKQGNPDKPYWASFFVVDTDEDTIIARKDIEFSLSIEDNPAESDAVPEKGDIITTFNWLYDGKRWRESFAISSSDYDNSILERDTFQPLHGKSDYKDGYILLQEIDITDFYSDLYGFLYQKNRQRLSDMISKFRVIQKKYSLDYRQFAEFIISCIQYTTYKLPDEMYGIYTQLELVKSKTGDCDTRSVLLYTILKELGYDVVIFYSEYYQHAMLGIANMASGEYLKYEGTKYYFVETTATGWDIGALPPEWSNTRHWQILIPLER